MLDIQEKEFEKVLVLLGFWLSNVQYTQTLSLFKV